MSSERTPGDKPLFTPGPLTTSHTVKEAMLRDLGSRDEEFLEVVREVRDGILALAGTTTGAGFEAIPIQGSGTYALESVLSSAVPRDGRVLVAVNGAYGERLDLIARTHGLSTTVIPGREALPIDPAAIEVVLASDPSVTHVAVVHCETTSGVMNPVEEIGEVVRRHRRSYFVDSMSAFGAIPIDLQAVGVDWLVSSANKCIEGVPGFAFVIARRIALERSEGLARTVSLDVCAQWRGLERDGQFRFTPPTQALLAFRQALRELEAEGGVLGRGRRYAANRDTLRDGMAQLGFREYVPREFQGPIITTFLYPDHENFAFEDFYRRLNDAGFVIYPGKVTDADCFRIGSIGRLYPSDVEALIASVATVLAEMRVELAPPS